MAAGVIRLKVHGFERANDALGNYSAIAQAIEVLCEQRGFYHIGYRDGIARSLVPEDVMALTLIALTTISFVLLGR